MKSVFLAVATSAALALGGCASNTLPKAASVEDYCDGAANFAKATALRRDQFGINELYARKNVRYEASQIENLPPRELDAMLYVVGVVYEKPLLSPDKVRQKVYMSCLYRREKKTWFQAGAV